MRVYEVTYILDPTMEEEQITQTQEKFSEMVTKNGGEIASVENWGKRKLAYELKGYSEGVYIIMKINSTDEPANILRRNLSLSDEVLRSMIIRLN
jgi:small subunit ribosomal protein S6